MASFTFPSTTARDFQAAAYLLSQGANLNTVAGMITRELSPEQVGVLNDLIQAARHHDINGVDVVVARLSVDNYVPDLAFLVHTRVDMENIKAIFVLALMANWDPPSAAVGRPPSVAGIGATANFPATRDSLLSCMSG